MNLHQLKGQIAVEAPACPECDEPFVDWPEADPTEGKVMYVAQDALFAGICSNGHCVEIYLQELKAGEVVAHMRSERLLGKKVRQSECKHPKKVEGNLEEGHSRPTPEGAIEGPCKIWFCLVCGAIGRVSQIIKPKGIRGSTFRDEHGNEKDFGGIQIP